MYLSLLNEKQKSLFFSLAYDVAVSDGNYSSEEQAVIESYFTEMNITFDISSVNSNLKEVINKLNDISERREKKIIIFEIIGLMMCDSNYDEGERSIIDSALKIFGLDQTYGEICEKKLTEYFQLQKRLNEIVLQ